MSESRLYWPTKLPGIFSVSILAFLLGPYFLSPHLDKLLLSSSKASLSPAPPREKPGTVVSNSPADLALTGDINRTIDESDLTQARWGVFVMSMNDGRVVYSRNSDKLFTPASNMKVYTTAVALDSLGADYRWRTSVYADKQPNDGIVEADLTLYGRGAPDLRSTPRGDAPSLTQLADQIYQSG